MQPWHRSIPKREASKTERVFLTIECARVPIRARCDDRRSPVATSSRWVGERALAEEPEMLGKSTKSMPSFVHRTGRVSRPEAAGVHAAVARVDSSPSSFVLQ
jgi:hypothetical protein